MEFRPRQQDAPKKQTRSYVTGKRTTGSQVSSSQKLSDLHLSICNSASPAGTADTDQPRGHSRHPTSPAGTADTPFKPKELTASSVPGSSSPSSRNQILYAPPVQLQLQSLTVFPQVFHPTAPSVPEPQYSLARSWTRTCWGEPSLPCCGPGHGPAGESLACPAVGPDILWSTEAAFTQRMAASQDLPAPASGMCQPISPDLSETQTPHCPRP